MSYIPADTKLPFSRANGHFDAGRQEVPYSELVKYLEKPVKGAKGKGGSFIPAIFSGKRRHKDDAIEAHYLALDIDHGATLAEISETLTRAGLTCVAYTTASHTTTVSKIKKSRFDSYRAVQGDIFNTIEEVAREYLIEAVGHHKSVTDAEIKVEERTVQDYVWTGEDSKKTQRAVDYVFISHGPICKVRIIYPMAKPWRVEDYANHKEACAAFKDMTLQLAGHLGLDADSSCCDPSHLYYLPTFTDDAGRNAYRMKAYDGVLLDPSTLPAAPEAKKRWAPARTDAITPGTAMPASLMVTDASGAAGDLVEWFTGHGGRTFELIEALYAAGAPQPERADGDHGQRHFICPRSEYHSSGRDDGFFAVAPEAGEGWRAACNHNGCHGLHRLHFLGAFIEAGVLSWADLRNAEYLPHSAGSEFDEIPTEDEEEEGAETTIAACDEFGVVFDPEELIEELRETLNKDVDDIHEAKTQNTLANLKRTSEKLYSKLMREFTGSGKNKVTKKRFEEATTEGERSLDHVEIDFENPHAGAKVIFKKSIPWSPGFVPEIGDEMEGFLSNSDRFYNYQGAIAEVRLTQYTVNKDKKKPGARMATPATLADALGRSFLFTTNDGLIQPPESLLKNILDRPAEKYRYLTGLVEAPILRQDGSICAVRGYDEATGLFLWVPEHLAFMIPENPTRADAEAALALLKGALGEFRFSGGGVPPEDDGDREAWGAEGARVSLAVALSGFLTAIARPTLPTAPMHCFSAPRRGSGKTYLVELIGAVATGREIAHLDHGNDDVEFEKVLGAELLDGASFISIDNVARPLGGSKLAQTLTASILKTRVLGESRNPVTPCTAPVFATGNHLRIAGDLDRRVVMGFMDPKMERPETRKFEADPKSEILKNRWEYVSACLTIMAAYAAAGRPGSLGYNSFDQWSRTVRSALVWLGEADPLASVDPIQSADVLKPLLRELLTLWYVSRSSKDETGAKESWVTVKSLVAAADFEPEFRDILREFSNSNGAEINKWALGNRLAKHKDQRVTVKIDGAEVELEIQQGPPLQGAVQWRVHAC